MEKRHSRKIFLKYVNPAVLSVGKCHTIWSTVRNNITDSRRAQRKCKLLTGSYILQANRAVFNQFQVDPICKLCSVAPGTCQHYIAECSIFEIERNSFKQKVCNYLPLREYDLQDPDTFSRLVLDSSAVFNHDVIDQSVISQTELNAREFVYKIHQVKTNFAK